MRLMAAFLVFCLLLLGAAVWMLSGTLDTLRELKPTEAPSTTQPVLDTAAAERAEGRADGSDVHEVEADAAAPATQPVAAGDDAALPVVESPAEAGAPAPHTPVKWAVGDEYAAARERLQRAREQLARDPTHAAALRDEAAALADLGDWYNAASSLGRLHRLTPDDTALQFEYASACMRGRRWIDAVRTLKALVATKPENARAWFNLAVAHEAVGHLSDARTAWDAAIALDPTPAAYARRGAVLLDLRENEAALADFERVRAATPEALDALLNATVALERLGRLDEARAMLRAHRADHPRHVPVLNRLGELAWAAYAQDRDAAARAEAVNCWRESLAIVPEQPAVAAALKAADAD
jgi:tetratricopeptide (TPR) repeat protein